MSREEKDFIRSFVGMHRQMERFLNDVFRFGHSSSFSGEQSWSPPVDVFECEDGFVVRVEAAGLDRESLEVTFDDGQITVSGCRRECCSHDRVGWRQMEIPYGSFKRSILISRNIDGDGITAAYSDGFLEIFLPSSGPGHHRRVRIQVD